MTHLRAALALSVLGYASIASAQITPAAGYTPPDDTPSIRVGVLIYPDYTYTTSPESADTDGNLIHPSSFNVSRAYVNITGNISHLVAFRVTPDVTRADTTVGTLLNGSYVYRIKYAYAQFNLDDWMTRGSYARFGIQQTPWIDFDEGIYRYRFQGTTFVEREGFFASADGGASFHYQLPGNYGDVHTGYFNGENYNRADPNDQKAFMFRGTIRPLPTGAMVLRGIRASFFYDADHYVKDAPRNRLIGALHYEHKYLNAGYYYLKTEDQISITRSEADGSGYTIWATPKTTVGWEALLRYDHLKPNRIFENQVRTRTIVGGAYWFPHQGNVATALLIDYDGQTFDNFAPAISKQARVAVHGLIQF